MYLVYVVEGDKREYSLQPEKYGEHENTVGYYAYAMRLLDGENITDALEKPANLVRAYVYAKKCDAVQKVDNLNSCFAYWGENLFEKVV